MKIKATRKKQSWWIEERQEEEKEQRGEQFAAAAAAAGTVSSRAGKHWKHWNYLLHSFLNLIHLQTYNFSFKLSAIQIMKFSLDINYKIKRLQTKLLPNFISQPCVCVCDSCIHAYVHLYLRRTYWCRSFFCMWYMQCTWTAPHRPLREFVCERLYAYF